MIDNIVSEIKKTNVRWILLLSVLLVGLVLSLTLIGTAMANLSAQEMPLNNLGVAYELHADTSNNLWITDYFAGQLWKVNAAGTIYTIYPVGATFPSDANPDASGNVWWLDGSTFINRMNTSTNVVTRWEIRAAVYLLGIGFDSTGMPWITDSSESILYSFDPSTKDACPYTVPNSGEITYPLVFGGVVWLGDTFNGRLVRLDFSGTPTWTWWQLPTNSYPYYLAKDASGNIWYTDQGNHALGEFTPSSNELRVYTLPTGTNPWMLAASGGKVWYTEKSLASIGVLDPSVAPPSPQTLTPTNVVASTNCGRLGNPDTSTLSPTSGVPSWPPASYTNLYQANGWSIYQLPPSAVPYGIALTSDGFAVDSYRQVLMRFTLPPTAVTLSNFTAKSLPQGIQLAWQSAQENELIGFNLFRAAALDGSRVKINSGLISAVSPGQFMGNDYKFVDTATEAGKTYSYWVEWVGTGSSEYYGPVTELLERFTFLPSVWR